MRQNHRQRLWRSAPGRQVVPRPISSVHLGAIAEHREPDAGEDHAEAAPSATNIQRQPKASMTAGEQCGAIAVPNEGAAFQTPIAEAWSRAWYQSLTTRAAAERSVLHQYPSRARAMMNWVSQ